MEDPIGVKHSAEIRGDGVPGNGQGAVWVGRVLAGYHHPADRAGTKVTQPRPATKNPAPGIGPPVTRTVHSRRRVSSGSAILDCRRSSSLRPLQVRTRPLRPLQDHSQRRLALAADPQRGQLPASTANANFSSTVALVGLAALSFSTTTEPISPTV